MKVDGNELKSGSLGWQKSGEAEAGCLFRLVGVSSSTQSALTRHGDGHSLKQFFQSKFEANFKWILNKFK